MALLWENTDLEQGFIRVKQSLVELKAGLQITEPKTRASKRLIPLAPDAVKVLRSHRARQTQERARLGVKWQDPK